MLIALIACKSSLLFVNLIKDTYFGSRVVRDCTDRSTGIG
jgi:hypothetical protein